MAVIRLPDHSHCIYCGDPIPFGEEYCSEECRAKEAARAENERRKDRLFYVIATVTIIVILAVGYFH